MVRETFGEEAEIRVSEHRDSERGLRVQGDEFEFEVEDEFESDVEEEEGEAKGEEKKAFEFELEEEEEVVETHMDEAANAVEVGAGNFTREMLRGSSSDGNADILSKTGTHDGQRLSEAGPSKTAEFEFALEEEENSQDIRDSHEYGELAQEQRSEIPQSHEGREEHSAFEFEVQEEDYEDEEVDQEAERRSRQVSDMSRVGSAAFEGTEIVNISATQIDSVPNAPKENYHPATSSKNDQAPSSPAAFEFDFDEDGSTPRRESRGHPSNAALPNHSLESSASSVTTSADKPREQASSTLSAEASLGPFTCIHCFTDNSQGSDCDICGKARPPSNRKWECASCTMDNLPADSRCHNCNMRRTANCKLSEVGFSQSSEIIYEKVLSDSYDSCNEEESKAVSSNAKRQKNLLKQPLKSATTAKDHDGAESSSSSSSEEEFDLHMDEDEHNDDNQPMSKDNEAAQTSSSSRPEEEHLPGAHDQDLEEISSDEEEFELTMDGANPIHEHSHSLQPPHDNTKQNNRNDPQPSRHTNLEDNTNETLNDSFEFAIDDHEQAVCSLCHQVSQSGSVLLECSKCAIHVHAKCYRISNAELAASRSFTCKACKPQTVDSQRHYITVCDDEVEEMDTQRSNPPQQRSRQTELIDLAASPIRNPPTASNFSTSRSASAFHCDHFVPLSQLPPEINRGMFKTKLAGVNFSRLNKRAEKLEEMEGKAPAQSKKGKKGRYKSKGKRRYRRR